MTKVLFTVLAFFFSTAMAATKSYDIKFDLSLNGKPAAYGQIVSKAGETATVYRDLEGGKTFIEVAASEGEIEGQKGILMKFAIGRIEKDGKKIVLAQPSILTNENDKAEVSFGGNKSHEDVKLSVVAKRKTL